jgi:hypothetical protein
VSEAAEARCSFSVVEGGPFSLLCARLGLLSPALGRTGRRAAALTALAWVPLAALSAAGPGGPGAFFSDAATQVRLLLALPLLVLTERFAHPRQRFVPAVFLERGLVRDADLPAFGAAIAAARRLRDGPLELWLLAVVAAARLAFWRLPVGTPRAGWALADSQAGPALTAAGLWYGALAVPLYQFLLLRWLARLFIWARLLWRLSRLDLRLSAAHPDRAGGLDFLSAASSAFSPLIFSQSALLAAMLSARVEPGGLAADRAAAAVLAAGLALVLGPLLPFAVQLDACKRTQLRRYGRLASGVVARFERRWLEGDWRAPLPAADLLEFSALGPAYDLAGRMRLLPFGLDTLARLGAAAAAPWLPLAVLSGRSLAVFKALVKGLLM